MKGGCANFWRKIVCCKAAGEFRMGINGHGGVGCGERSPFITTRLFHDAMPDSCLATCKMSNAQEVPL